MAKLFSGGNMTQRNYLFKKIFLIVVIAVFFTALISFWGCGKPEQAPDKETEKEVVSKVGKIKAAGKLIVGTSAEYPPYEFHLLKDKEALKKILLYHVVSGNVMSTDVVKLTEAATVEGSKVKISVKDGNVMINDAKVIKADVKASNGVIHVIDTVILPPTK